MTSQVISSNPVASAVTELSHSALIRLQEIERRPLSWLFVAAAACIVLNLVDALFTLVYVTSGAAVEANPLMAVLLDASPLWFMIGKLALVSLGVQLLWRFRHQRLAVLGLCTVLCMYTALAAYHVSSIRYLL